jgi:3-hydroxybutyryl-CoA dehydratase
MVEIGQTFSATRTLTQQDFDAFARLSGDDNPIHVDPDFARNTRFGRPVAHGMMLYGLICRLLGTHLPGAAQIEQELIFPAPTFAGEAIAIAAKVTEIDGKKVRMATTIRNSTGELTCEGHTVLYWEAL